MASNRYFLAIPLLAVLVAWHIFLVKSATVEFTKANLPPFAQEVIRKTYELDYTYGGTHSTSGELICAAIPYTYNGEPYIVTIEIESDSNKGTHNLSINLYNIYGDKEKTLLTKSLTELQGDIVYWQIYYYNLGEKLIITLPVIHSESIYGYLPLSPISEIFYHKEPISYYLYEIVIENKSVVNFELVKTIENVTYFWGGGFIGVVLEHPDERYIAYMEPLERDHVRFVVEDMQGNVIISKDIYDYTDYIVPAIYETKDYIYFGYVASTGEVGIYVFDKKAGTIKELLEGRRVPPIWNPVWEYIVPRPVWLLKPLIGDYNKNIVYLIVGDFDRCLWVFIEDQAYCIEGLFPAYRMFIYDDKIMTILIPIDEEANVTIQLFNYTVAPETLDIQKIGEGILYDLKEEGVLLGNYSEGGYIVLPHHFEILYTNKSYLVSTVFAMEYHENITEAHSERARRQYIGLLVIEPNDKSYSLKPIKEYYGGDFSTPDGREGIITFMYLSNLDLYSHPRYVLLVYIYNDTGGYTEEDIPYYHSKVKSIVYVLTSKELEKPQQPTQPSPPTTPTSPPAPPESPIQLQEETTPPKTNVSNVTQPAVQAVVLVSPQTMVLIGFLVATMILLYLYYSRRR